MARSSQCEKSRFGEGVRPEPELLWLRPLSNHSLRRMGSPALLAALLLWVAMPVGGGVPLGTTGDAAMLLQTVVARGYCKGDTGIIKPYFWYSDATHKEP